MEKGGWIFISHSHKDVEKVRILRNKLESMGFDPLLFYLKCLSDENEIEGLIKREIDERDWFIYADSKNARASKWVQTEREYIEGFVNKKVFTVDLNSDINEQLSMMEHVARQMKVFISYQHRDTHIKNQISQKLIEKGFLPKE